MTATYTSADLKKEILALEASCQDQEKSLKETAGAVMESLQPANLIKNTLRSTVKAPGFGKGILKGALGLAAGFLSKRLVVGASSNIIKKAVGTVVELGVAKAVTNKADKLIHPDSKKPISKSVR